MKAKKILIGVIIAVILATTGICRIIGTGILNPFKYQIKLGYKYLEQGKYDDAVIAFNKALEIDDKNILPYELLGTLYIMHPDDDSTENMISLLKSGYEKADSEEIIKMYLEFAENLISSEHFNYALQILNSGLDTTGSEKIKEKIYYMYENDMLEDISETMNKQLSDDFSNLVAASSSSGINTDSGKGLLEEYKYLSNNKRDLIFMFMSDYAGTYLKEKNTFKWNVDYIDADNDGYEDTLKVPAEQMDWVLKNYFNVSEAHDLTLTEPYGSGSVYYFDGYYYSQLTERGDMQPSALIEKVFSLGDNKYYFEYKKHWKADGIYNDEDSASKEKYYAVLQRKKIDGVEFWSFIDASEHKLNLIDYIK